MGSNKHNDKNNPASFSIYLVTFEEFSFEMPKRRSFTWIRVSGRTLQVNRTEAADIDPLRAVVCHSPIN